MSEKTENATPYKLEKAKEKGLVSKSIELNTCSSLLVLLGLINSLWPQQLKDIQSVTTHLLYLATHMHLTLDTISHLHQLLLSKLLTLWLPFALAAVISVVLSTVLQTGFVWSMTPIIPDFKRLDVVQGCKRLFSINTMVALVKSIFKLMVASTLLYLIFKNQLATILHFMFIPAPHAPQLMMHFILKTLFQLIAALLCFAFIDTMYSRRMFLKKQKMTKQEIKDEYKQKEGDPKIKNKIKQLQFQLRQKTSALKQVETSDLIITNPAHLAIALKYERQSMPAPKVVYKAQDELVLPVKALARKHNIPIIENKLCARMLYHSTELNQYIGKELFPLIAPLFRELYQQQERQ